MVGGPKPEGYGTKKAEGVPGHACAVPVGAGAFGGARGCIQRPKVSTIVMRPPQHGHGRRGSAGGAGSGVLVDDGAASRSRTRAILALRVALAKRP